MARKVILGVLVGLVAASSASAQVPVRLKWQTGQVHTYKVDQLTTASDVVGQKTTETKSRMNLTKKWQVTGVDAQGVATLQLTLAALRIETTTPGGETLLFDSAQPDKSNPQMKEQLSKYVGVPLATLRVDSVGRVHEVKESKFGPASKYDNELPFVGLLPVEALKPQLAWERPYKMTLDPPQGTGEKYDAVQKFACKSATADWVVVTMATELKKGPEAAADNIPLLQLQPEGEIVYDVKNGRLRSAALKVEKELKGHMGEGSVYRFTSQYTEVIAE